MIKIREKFLQLTSNRTPKGTEANVIALIPEFKFEKDEFDNYYYIIKKSDGTFSNTMFTSHLDTIDRGPSSWDTRTWDPTTKIWTEDKTTVVNDDGKPIVHVFEDDFVKTNGKTNLGADDKTGVTIMLNLMSENVPGLYYFFMGEESGCVGSSNLSRVYETKVKNGVLPQVNKCISFDRKGYDSVITEQMGGVCCSDEFANDLSSKLNEYGFWYKPDNTGVYTDSAEFIDIIQECTNLSVGYFSEHTTSEKQDLEFLELLATVVTKIDWESLTIVRDTSKINYKGKKSNSYGRYSEYYNGRYAAWNDGYWDDYDSRRPVNLSTTTTNGLVKPNSNVIETVDDTEFDRWYTEQKNKGWKSEDVQVTV
jgi:hypothetical protein